MRRARCSYRPHCGALRAVCLSDKPKVAGAVLISSASHAATDAVMFAKITAVFAAG